MSWWHRLFSRTGDTAARDEYVIAYTLYSNDGKRCVDVLERKDGVSYYVDKVRLDDMTFTRRAPDSSIGPFKSPEAAEAAAVSRPWFATGMD